MGGEMSWALQNKSRKSLYLLLTAKSDTECDHDMIISKIEPSGKGESVESPHKGSIMRSFNVSFCLAYTNSRVSWWRHQMETFSALLTICAGNSPVPVNSPHKGQWRGALVFSLICVWINGWVNNREAGDLRRYRAHYDVTVMSCDLRRCDTNVLQHLLSGTSIWYSRYNVRRA